jgi:PAS domain S-box-containing protein
MIKETAPGRLAIAGTSSNAAGGSVTPDADEARRRIHEANARLAAIVESSDDAIISKTLEGIITSWNGGARRLFQFTAEEAIGQPITILIPPDRVSEEDEILARIRSGRRVDHFETVRRRKDGSLLSLSLTISPIHDENGAVIGASKVARDISERMQALEQQRLILREMNHRVKNLFAMVSSLVGMTARTCNTANELATALVPRIMALAKAHELTLPDMGAGTPIDSTRTTTLFSLLEAILAPHEGTQARIEISGSDVPVQGGVLTSLALLLNEFTTNATKYGALSSPDGHLSIDVVTTKDTLELTWKELGGPPVEDPGRSVGFGSHLERATVQGSLHGSIDRVWAAEGLTIRLSVPLEKVVA